MATGAAAPAEIDLLLSQIKPLSSSTSALWGVGVFSSSFRRAIVRLVPPDRELLYLLHIYLIKQAVLSINLLLLLLLFAERTWHMNQNGPSA